MITHESLGSAVLDSVIASARENGLIAFRQTSKKGVPYVVIQSEPFDYSVCWFYGSRKHGTTRGLKLYWPFPSFGRSLGTKFMSAPRYLCGPLCMENFKRLGQFPVEFILNNPVLSAVEWGEL